MTTSECRARAVRKLDWIISREGDMGGERLKPYYLAQLIVEQIQAEALQQECLAAFGKKFSRKEEIV